MEAEMEHNVLKETFGDKKKHKKKKCGRRLKFLIFFIIELSCLFFEWLIWLKMWRENDRFVEIIITNMNSINKDSYFFL